MNLRPLLFVVSSLLLLGVPACSSSSGNTGNPPADAGHDTATDASSGPDASGKDASSPAKDAASDAAPVCNTLPNTAPSIPVDQMAAEPPAPQGGTPADGTYALTAAVIYTGAEGPSGASGTAQTTLTITGSTIQVVSTGEPATRTVTFTTSGTTIDSVDTCPDTDTRSGGYTATATTFIVQLDAGTDDAGARTLVETFTMQ
jgi:hypothetical protein